MNIQLKTENETPKLAKAQTSLSTVQCILKKGSSTVHDQTYSKSGSSFSITIDELEPASDYSLLIYGMDSSGDILGRASQSNISVSAGNTANVSIIWVKFQPLLSSPSNGSTITDNTPYFDWSDVNDASVYELEVDNSSSFSNPEIDQSNLTSSDYTATSALSDDTYYWRLRVKDSQGNWGGWSSTWSFTIDTQGPSAPTLSSPTNGSTITDNTPYFDWSDVNDASVYDLEVDNSSSFSNPEIDQSSLTSSDYTATSALSDDTYYWRLRVKDSQGNWGGWSETGSFTVHTQSLAAPTLTSPTNGSGVTNNVPSFDWIYVSGTSVYELQVDDSDDFSSPEIDKSDITSSSFIASISLTDGTWYWRVRCQDSGGFWGDWSSAWSFIVITLETGTVTDIDGNSYQTVKIGDQWWMAENLRVTHFRNGEDISSYCAYNNEEYIAEIYGYLYYWNAVTDDRKIAPTGWKVPSDEDWEILIETLGGEGVAANKLKESGDDHWSSSTLDVTNESGFTALPGGYRCYNYGEAFTGLNSIATFWSNTPVDNEAWYFIIGNASLKQTAPKHESRDDCGFSVRCIKE